MCHLVLNPQARIILPTESVTRLGPLWVGICMQQGLEITGRTVPRAWPCGSGHGPGQLLLTDTKSHRATGLGCDWQVMAKLPIIACLERRFRSALSTISLSINGRLLGSKTTQITSGRIIIVLAVAAKLFHGHVGLAEK